LREAKSLENELKICGEEIGEKEWQSVRVNFKGYDAKKALAHVRRLFARLNKLEI